MTQLLNDWLNVVSFTVAFTVAWYATRVICRRFDRRDR